MILRSSAPFNNYWGPYQEMICKLTVAIRAGSHSTSNPDQLLFWRRENSVAFRISYHQSFAPHVINIHTGYNVLKWLISTNVLECLPLSCVFFRASLTAAFSAIQPQDGTSLLIKNLSPNSVLYKTGALIFNYL